MSLGITIIVIFCVMIFSQAIMLANAQKKRHEEILKYLNALKK